MKYPKISSGIFALNDAPPGNGPKRHAFDLEERTALFGEAIIRFAKLLVAAQALELTIVKPTSQFPKRISNASSDAV